MSTQNVDRLETFKSITTEVFALTLGLGAFSLSLFPRTSLMNVAQAVGAFAIAFFYIALIWIIQSRFFEKYPLYDDTFLALNFVILFLVAISPFLMQGFWQSSDFADPMSTLYALDIMGIYAILGILHQNRGQLTAEATREVKNGQKHAAHHIHMLSSVRPHATTLPGSLLDVPCPHTAPIPPPYRPHTAPIPPPSRSTPCEMMVPSR